MMVFLSSCNSVKFHAELLNYIDIPVMDIHVRRGRGERGGEEGTKGKFYTHIASAHAHNSHYKCFFRVTPGRC